MIDLVIVVVTLLSVSFLCSMLEAVILSIRRSYVQSLVDAGSRAGSILQRLMDRVEEPVSAIVTLNTIAHTVGATVSGAMAARYFGSEWVGVFSGVLTFLVLVGSEIIPKTLGAHHWKSLAPASAYLLEGILFVMKPFLVPLRFLNRLIAREDTHLHVSKADIISSIRVGYLQGVIQPSEFTIMENLLNLRSIKVRDIMTPRTVVSWIPADVRVGDLVQAQRPVQFSRLPVYNVQEDTVEGVVMRRDIMNEIAAQRADTEVRGLAREPLFVLDNMTVSKLLNQFISSKVHLAVVLNEYGDFTGVVTMEDAIETLLGKEIVDEFDQVVDMRKLARKKGSRLFRRGRS